MPLDPNAFDMLLNQTRRSVVETRDSNSDQREAKANIEVNRILDEGNRLVMVEELKVEEYDESEKEIANGTSFQAFSLPPQETAGLEDPNIELDESQVAAIDMLIQEQYGCLIGAAGSGKTTVLKYFLAKMIYGDSRFDVSPMKVKMLEGKQGLNIAICAFTGIATQVIKHNMPDWLHPACKTIHSLLEYMPTTSEVTDANGNLKESRVFLPSRTRINKLDHDIIIIDEASMVGLDLWHYLLDACRPGTKIFLVGDLNQLPPVTSHSMFAYALSAWKVAELTHIHRQKEPSANRIVDTAHSILNGKEFHFDDQRVNPDWRVIGFEVDSDPQKAGVQIVAIANQLRTKKVSVSVDPTQPLIYDPYRDRIITAGNGYDENDTRSAVQQSWINDALSQLIEPPSDEHPRFIIDAGMGQIKKFAVGYRVMATKNEPPDVVDRVTNGMVGVIKDISRNPSWSGNHALVGPEHLVKEARKQQIERVFSGLNPTATNKYAELDALETLNADEFDVSGISDQKQEKEGGGPASHRVIVEFANGATRTFVSKANVQSLQLAYASTCHKCQGSQFDTAIIVCHHIVKGQLSREWLYTAVTRAQKRVIFLYTKFGIRASMAKQKIFGRNLEEKIRRYKALQEEGIGPSRIRVRLSIESI